MLLHRKTVRIEWGDGDPAGIVYDPRYCACFDNCTTALFEEAGLLKHEMLKKYEIVGIPMVELKVRFLAPSRFGDHVVIESTATEWRGSSFFVHLRLLRNEVLAVECFETRVGAIRSPENPEVIQSQPLPGEGIERFTGARRMRRKRHDFLLRTG
jgi:4-hydroxybenzoyl-CoA thioesterase